MRLVSIAIPTYSYMSISTQVVVSSISSAHFHQEFNILLDSQLLFSLSRFRSDFLSFILSIQFFPLFFRQASVCVYTHIYVNIYTDAHTNKYNYVHDIKYREKKVANLKPQ